MQILFPRGILLFASDRIVTQQIHKLRIKDLEFTLEFHQVPTIVQKSTEQIAKYILIEGNRKSSIKRQYIERNANLSTFPMHKSNFFKTFYLVKQAFIYAIKISFIT